MKMASTVSEERGGVVILPSTLPSSRYTRTGITGECHSPVSLTLLVPKDRDGLTTSGHLTFFWHVSAPVQMAFTLTQRGVVQPLWEQQIQLPTAGIVQLQMPINLIELLVGKEYHWSVTLLCNRYRPSAYPFFQT